MPIIDGKETTPDSGFRHWLAGGITGISIISVVALAIVIVVSGTETTRAQFIFSAVLPVIGTWVGTVLAYYFSKESLETATRSVQSIVRQLTPEEKLEQILAKDKMIPKDQMFFKRTPEIAVNLVATINEMTTEGKGNRVPILNEKDWPVYVIHRSTIDRYLAERTRAVGAPDQTTLTLQDLLNDSGELRQLLQNSFVIVSDRGTLRDVKAAMDRVTTAQDAFVTQAGTPKEPILGWITNVIIEDNAKL